MATEAVNQLYPFSTEQGNSIPLDIIRPLGALVAAIEAETASSVVIPAAYREVSIRVTVDCLLDFENAATYPASGPYSSAIVLSKDYIVTVQLPVTGTVKVVPLVAEDSGMLYINAIQKWAGMGLSRQVVRR